jgi:hypothetical protein
MVGCSAERRSSRGPNVNASDTPNFAADRKPAERLDIARRVYQALAGQDPDRVIILRDGHGRVVARHDPRPEQDASEIAP